LEFTKIIKGVYGNKETGFYIERDSSLEGQLKWVIQNINPEIIEVYIADGNDQIYHTLKEAKQSIKI
tara:strand:+ start:926 stop:1126 length:201 start_codon:yes stop_codon:yes gene_type:complete